MNILMGWILGGAVVGAIVGWGIVNIYFLIFPMKVKIDLEQLEKDKQREKRMQIMSDKLDEMMDN